MISPFPGMDPYLEQHWRDVHHRLCTYACDALQSQIRPALLARIEERLIVECEGDDDRSIFPDVKVVEGRNRHRFVEDGAVAVLDEPVIVQVPSEQPTEGYIQIIDPTTGGKLVTVIEFLSPTNKLPGEGQKEYRQKQLELRTAGVSLVEIDLLRAGEWVLQVPRSKIKPADRTPYRACVHRGWKPKEYEFYRMPIKQRLAKIRIPLRERDADARLDLQALIDQTYMNGAYDSLNYARLPVPRLEPAVAQWAQELLLSAGKIKRKK